ncbi:ABC transporter permease [Psychromonas antarctica]|jgi:putative ABC transport system permease protein|uniref:ABC transporter permease n=1 Tax=Psychromonas antarctica TaxID=67573 RepID=UPI001EE8417A|nr:ABC transporter permease [Psychromonas antarctica]MCG6201822.1 ABC transporter permease [Psychromonas antarctica]
MLHSVDISWAQLALFSVVLIIPLLINRYYQLAMTKEILIAVSRMTVQLILVGLYLQYVFSINSLLLNVMWIIVMILIGSSAIVGKAQLPKRALFMPVTCGLTVGLLPLMLLLCYAIIRPDPVYSAQYVIPLAGMLLGNSLSCNIVALQNLFEAFALRKNEYEAAIALGADPQSAARPFVLAALKKAQAPILASMATTGLVTLPGMMTGQILAGADPILAIKYQLVIMIAIFVMTSVSLTITLQLSLQSALDKTGLVKVKIFN